MHEETPHSSRGHIQARLGGKVNNREALSTSSRRIESTADLDPAHHCPSKSPTRVFHHHTSSETRPTSPSPNTAPSST
jgi:hypothetical protein